MKYRINIHLYNTKVNATALTLWYNGPIIIVVFTFILSLFQKQLYIYKKTFLRTVDLKVLRWMFVSRLDMTSQLGVTVR